MNNLTHSFVSIIFIIFFNIEIQNAQSILKESYINAYNGFTNEKSLSLKKSSDDSILTEVGRWGEGPCYTVRAVGNYLAVGNGSVLQILDFKNLDEPTLISEILTESIIEDMEVSGNYIYKISPFQVIDISKPENPQIIFTDTIGSDASKITINGNFAYVGDFVGNVYIIDISNPIQPKKMGTMLASGENVLSIEVKEPYLFVSTWASYVINIFDISDKNNPVSLPRFWTTSSAPHLRIYNNYLFEAGGATNGFKIYDISILSDLKIIGQTTIGQDVSDITVIDTLLYLTGYYRQEYRGYLKILNISDISKPIILSDKPLTEPPFGTAQQYIKDDLIFIAVGRGLTILDKNNISNPYQTGYYSTAFSTVRIQIKDNYAFIASDYVGLKIVDFSIPDNPRTIGEFITNSRVYDIGFMDNTLYLYTDTALIALNISNPLKPKKISSIHISAPPDGDAYLEFNNLTIFNNYAFITYQDSSIALFNVSNPENIYMLLKFKSANRSFCVNAEINNDSLIIFSAEGDSGLQIYFTSFPIFNNSNVKKIYYRENLPILGMFLKENRLYLASTGLDIMNIENPGQPKLLGRIDTPGSRVDVDITVNEKFAYLAYGGNLVIVDISNSLSPFIRFHLEDYWTNNVITSDNLILLGIGLRGMKILKNNLITTINADYKTSIPALIHLEQNYPNPFNTSTVISYQLPKGSFVTLKIYNVLGKEVATLINEYKDQGRYTSEFNGSSLASGIYLYELRAGDYVSSKKMLMIK